MHVLHKNVTWDLVPLPSDMIALPCNWVYQTKVTANDGKLEDQARLIVAMGFEQQQGIHFDEIFFPIVKMINLHCVLALLAREDKNLIHVNVKKTFLHYLYVDHEDIYMHQTKGFVVKGNKHLVCKLKKSIYGLKQAPSK
ncbi:hypothetical protein L7F22_002754 [Adiantum nelumboides]|nr:hypothetical protein [Adiantum nelumboides]